MSTKRVLGALIAGAFAITACTGPSAGPSVRPTGGTSGTPAASPTSAASPTGVASPTGGASPTMSHDMSPSPSAGQPSPSGDASPSGEPSPSGAAIDVMSPAANLRTDLNYLLGEHLIFAAKSTGSALGGRQDEFEAYGGLLNTNGTDIGAAIGSIYGAEAEDEFNRIWSAHNGFFVDYTTGLATDNQEMADQAVNDLMTVYVPEFSAFLAGATGLPEDALAEGITEHVNTTIAIIDAQAAGDFEAAYAAIRGAYAHMSMLGDTLAPAIAETNAIEGDAMNAGVGFRTALNQLLQEHLYLASSATGSALGGRQDEFAAAGSALNTNGTDIGAAIGSIYGAEAEDEFNRIWSAHNGFFVDYTTGLATDNQEMADQAVNDLMTVYVPEFSAFLAGATGLPEDALAEGITEHVNSTIAIIDAQAAGDAAGAAEADRAAGMHMRMLGDTLAPAIVEAMPDSFR